MTHESLLLPIDKLDITSSNARKDHTVDRALVASIASVGLLYPLVVDAMPNERYDVIDGAQRLLAIRAAIDQGLVPAERFAMVPCMGRANGSASVAGLETSLHANLRTPMHPLDECEAILTLAKEIEDKHEIALRFGQDVRWLEQRVKLANLAKEVKQAFRDGRIGLAHAMKFTLGTTEAQAAFLRKNKDFDFNAWSVENAMTEQKINAKHVNFDLSEYPGEKMEADLFGDDVFLLDRDKVRELQDEWARVQMTALKAEGYDNVTILQRTDWSTLEKHVKVTGRISSKDKGKLSCFIKADNNGLIHVYKDMAPRKLVDDKGKIRKKVETADEVAAEDVKPTTCMEWSANQNEIINALAASTLYARAIEGDMLFCQFLVVDNQLGKGTWTQGGKAEAYNGPATRWERLGKQYPGEQIIKADEIETMSEEDRAKFSFKVWSAMTPKKRAHLFHLACASMIEVPPATVRLQPNLPELEEYEWLVPGEEFFKRFTNEQLYDYRQRSGEKDAGKTPNKKADNVTNAVHAAGSRTAFQFGLSK